MENMFVEAFVDCINQAADDDLVRLQIHGGRFYVFGHDDGLKIGLNVGSIYCSASHESIAHLASIDVEADQEIAYDEVMDGYPTSPPTKLRQKLLDCVSLLAVEIYHAYDSKQSMQLI